MRYSSMSSSATFHLQQDELPLVRSSGHVCIMHLKIKEYSLNFLRGNTFLTTLILEDCHLNHDAASLTRILLESRNIRHLTLKKNGLSEQGVETLVTLLNEKSGIETFDIQRNPCGERSINRISSILERNTSLKSLSISVKLAQREACWPSRLARAIMNNYTLHVLNIEQYLNWEQHLVTPLTMETVFALFDATAINVTLQCFNLSKNLFTPEAQPEKIHQYGLWKNIIRERNLSYLAFDGEEPKEKKDTVIYTRLPFDGIGDEITASLPEEAKRVVKKIVVTHCF